MVSGGVKVGMMLLRTRITSRAIVFSSLVGTTSTRTRESSMEISPSPSVTAAFRSRSISMPMNSRPESEASRTSTDFSPMPPVKRTASTPPMAAA